MLNNRETIDIYHIIYFDLFFFNIIMKSEFKLAVFDMGGTLIDGSLIEDLKQIWIV